MRRLGWLVPLVALAGCGGSTSATPAFRDVGADAERRTGHRIHWRQTGDDDRKVDDAVRSLLAKPLSSDAAVYIALVRNPALQATYEELSIAQADFVQAGLLKNPVLSAGVGFNNVSSPDFQVGVGWDFADLFTRSARRTIANDRLEIVKLRVGGEILRAAYDTRAAYFTLQGALQMASVRRVVAEAADAAVDLARRQHDAGNISDLDRVNQETQSAQAKLDLARAELEGRGAREQLIRALGMWSVPDSLIVPDRLPDIPPEELALDQLEQVAIAQRLDVAAARKESEAAYRFASLARQTRFGGGATVGASYEHRSVEHERSFGPTAGVELPLFDQHQAQIARAEAEARQAEQRLQALAAAARSEIRSVRDRLVFLRHTAVHFRSTLVPMRERAVKLTQEQYDAMLTGVYQLLAAKQAEVSAYREYLETVRDYWIARAELERAVGGRLGPPPPIEAMPAPAEAPPSGGGHEHHHMKEQPL